MATGACRREQRGCRVAAATSSRRNLSGRRRCLGAGTGRRGRWRQGLALQITAPRGEEHFTTRENHTDENQQGCPESDVPSRGHWRTFPYIDVLWRVRRARIIGSFLDWRLTAYGSVARTIYASIR